MKRLIVALAGIAFLVTSCGGPAFVDKVTIANPHGYNMIVSVSGDGESWLLLGGVDGGDEVTREQVIDVGERWIFRFRYPYNDDVEPAVVSFTRSELSGAGWRVEVPKTFAETLRKRGQPTS